jgi:methyltransferase (TIGR00027 family)
MRITHVSETALWVAAYRAMETKRQDALFHDHLAERLAGDRGRAIAQRMDGSGNNSAWSIVTRTVALDEMIEAAIRSGATTVLNLAAGLDTRPYRLSLPPELRWVEVDFPETIAYKEAALAGESPRCALERVPLDLTDRAARRSLFDRLDREDRNVLVVTEGLLIYLTEDDVASLASDLRATSRFRWWIADILTPDLLAWLLRNRWKSLAESGVRMRFGVEPDAGFFNRHGWRIANLKRLSEESRRIHREMPRANWYRFMTKLSPPRVRERYRKFDSYFLSMEPTPL